MRGLNEDEVCNFVALTQDKVSLESRMMNRYMYWILKTAHTRMSAFHVFHVVQMYFVFPFQALDVRFIEYMPFDGKPLHGNNNIL